MASTASCSSTTVQNTGSVNRWRPTDSIGSQEKADSMMNCCWLFWPRTGRAMVETLSRISAADAMLDWIRVSHVERAIHHLAA